MKRIYEEIREVVFITFMINVKLFVVIIGFFDVYLMARKFGLG